MTVHPPDRVVAALPRRFAGWLIDGGLAFLAILVTQWALLPINLARMEPSPWRVHLWVLATVSVPMLLWFTWRDRSPRAASPGAAWLGLAVVRVDGARLTWSSALVRNFLKLLPFELNHVALFHGQVNDQFTATAWIGWIGAWGMVLVTVWLALRSPDRQTLHDRATGTVVVRRGQ
jgi:uncharacterized RDD family membrane protein YckC